MELFPLFFNLRRFILKLNLCLVNFAIPFLEHSSDEEHSVANLADVTSACSFWKLSSLKSTFGTKSQGTIVATFGIRLLVVSIVTAIALHFLFRTDFFGIFEFKNVRFGIKFKDFLLVSIFPLNLDDEGLLFFHHLINMVSSCISRGPIVILIKIFILWLACSFFKELKETILVFQSRNESRRYLSLGFRKHWWI